MTLIPMKVLATFIILTVFSLNIMAQQKIVQTAGRTQLGEFAPEFAHLAFEISGENSSNEWLGPVCDEEYDKLK